MTCPITGCLDEGTQQLLVDVHGPGIRPGTRWSIDVCAFHGRQLEPPRRATVGRPTPDDLATALRDVRREHSEAHR